MLEGDDTAALGYLACRIGACLLSLTGSLHHAEQDVPAGEELFRIPLLLCISAWDTGGFKSSMEGERMVTDGHAVPAHIFVATKCLREMQLPDSPWQPCFQANSWELLPVPSAALCCVHELAC